MIVMQWIISNKEIISIKRIAFFFPLVWVALFSFVLYQGLLGILKIVFGQFDQNKHQFDNFQGIWRNNWNYDFIERIHTDPQKMKHFNVIYHHFECRFFSSFVGFVSFYRHNDDNGDDKRKGLNFKLVGVVEWKKKKTVKIRTGRKLKLCSRTQIAWKAS